MSTRVIRYRTQPDRADENQKLVEAVFAELAERQPAGVRYACLRGPDGSFSHVVTLDDDDAPNPLLELAAFNRFQAGIGERCAEPPVAAEVTVVGSYGLDISS
jgi:hypothetical protein